MSDRLTAAQIAEIEERAAKATPGPWIRSGVREKIGDEDCIASGPDGALLFFTSIGYQGREQAQAIRDSEFLAHARTDIPALVRDLRAAREALASLLDACAAVNSGHATQVLDPHAEAAARAALPEETPNG